MAPRYCLMILTLAPRKFLFPTLMMVDYIFALFCSLSLLVTVSASVNIASSNEDVCIGENLILKCSVNGTVLRWNYNGSSASYSTSGSTNPRPLNIFQAEFISICNGILSSSATVNVSSDSVANTFRGTTIFCDDPSATDASSNYTININVKESASISFLVLQLIPERIIKLDWGGAQCASHYIIEVNDSFVNTTNGTSYNYMIPPNEDTFIFTVRGVNYTGNVFTSISKTLTGPICSANPILADNGTLFITIKSENSSQLPLTFCYVTFNSMDRNCSEANRVVRFDDVAPGEYKYSVIVGNAIASNVCDNDPDLITVDPSTTVSSSVDTTPTATIIESPCGPDLPGWALGVIIALVILLIIAVMIIIVLSCIIWSNQDKNNKRVNTTNLRTKSPDEKEGIHHSSL